MKDPRRAGEHGSAVLLVVGGGFQGALFHNATLGNIKKNSKGKKNKKQNKARAPGGSNSEGDFLKMSLKTVITEAASRCRQSVPCHVTARTTAEAPHTLCGCEHKRGGSSSGGQFQINQQAVGKSQIQNKDGVRADIHAPNSNFLPVSDCFG